MDKKFIKFGRIFLETTLMMVFLFYLFYPQQNYSLLTRICLITLLIITTFIFVAIVFDRKEFKKIFNLTNLFFIVFSIAQTIKNINIPVGLPSILYELVHYILTYFILFYNLKHEKIITTGLILFIVYSFRIFDLNLVDNEFTLIHGLSLILGLLWLEDVINKKNYEIIKNPLLIPIILFLIIGLISTINAVSYYGSLQQFLIILNFAFIAFLISTYIKNKEQIDPLLFTMYLISSVLVILALIHFLSLQSYFGITKALKSRIWIGKIHPNSIADYFIAMLLVCFNVLPFYNSNILRLWLKILITAMLIILLLTYSRLGWLSFGFAILLSAFFHNKQKVYNKISKSFFLIIIFIIAILTLSPIRDKIIERLFDVDSNSRNFYNCEVVLNTIKDNFLFGVGINNNYILSKYSTRPITIYGQHNIRVTRELLNSSPHSLFLGILWGMGIFGLAVFIWLLTSFFNYALYIMKNLTNGYTRSLLVGIFLAMVAISVHGILSMTFHLTVLPAFFWVFIGITMAIGNVNLVQFNEYKK